ncbi:TadE family protein [Serinicoccus sp. LYQ131]|uniref:TadE family protein n=1 Tax=Serinicoccus sp. LYQ131 TaxID=3378797 RepID=UPI0038530E37
MRRSAPDRGAAASEFAMLAGLVSVLLLAAMQLAFALHVHNTATAHVIEGARVGARADATPAEGVARARELMSASMSGIADGAVLTGTRRSVAGVEVVELTAEVRLPILGPFGPGGALTVTGQAYAEDQG